MSLRPLLNVVWPMHLLLTCLFHWVHCASPYCTRKVSSLESHMVNVAFTVYSAFQHFRFTTIPPFTHAFIHWWQRQLRCHLLIRSNHPPPISGRPLFLLTHGCPHIRKSYIILYKAWFQQGKPTLFSEFIWVRKSQETLWSVFSTYGNHRWHSIRLKHVLRSPLNSLISGHGE